MRKLTFLVAFLFIVSFAYSQGQTLPYAESFETGLGIWTQLTNDNFDWTRTNEATPSPNTGPTEASDGEFYLFIESDGHTTSTQDAQIEAVFDFTATKMPIMALDYHVWGETSAGFLFVSVFVDGQKDDVFKYIFGNENKWLSTKICLGKYAGKANVKIIIKANTENPTSRDVAIDNIRITDFDVESVTPKNVACGGYSDGEIEINIKGGFGPYMYSINNGAEFVEDANSTYTFTNLSGKDYSIRVSDGGCEVPFGKVNVAEPPIPNISTKKEDISGCAGNKNGKIEIKDPPAGSPYEYSITGIDGPYQSANVFNFLDTGLYRIAVKDKINGCITEGQPVTIFAPKKIIVTNMVKRDITTCFGDCEGFVKATVAGGHPPLEFSIDEGTSFDGFSSFSGLCAGDYRIIIRDALGCVDTTDYVTVVQPEFLEVTQIEAKNVEGCNGDKNGQISIVSVGGTGQTEYSIDNGIDYQENGLFENLSAGAYHVMVRDKKGCTFDGGAINITQPEILLIDSVNFKDVTGCAGDSDGEISIYAKGGTGNLSFSIDSGITLQASNNFTNLSAGKYYPYVVDENGCERRKSEIEIEQPFPLEINDSYVYDVKDCYNDQTGRIQIIASLGAAPYKYSINGGEDYQSSSMFDNLPAGDYYLAVQDANNCELIGDTVTILQPDDLVITEVTGTDVSCYGNEDGSMIVNAEGGTGKLKLSIDNGNSFPYWVGQSNPVGAGEYNIVIKDENDCIWSGGNLVVNQPDSLSIDSIAITNIADCYGDSTGVIEFFISGGQAPFNYSIDNGATTQTSNLFENLPGKTGYIPSVVDANGCPAGTTNSLTISQPAKLSIYGQTHTDVDTCHGSPAGSITVNGYGGTGTISYSIDDGENYYENDGFFDNLYAGTYKIKIKDEKNCVDIGWEETILEPDLLVLDSVAHDDIICNGQGNGSITIYAHGGKPQLYYSVNGGVNFSPSLQFMSLSPAHYEIVVRDAHFCTVSSSLDITQPPALFLDSVSHTDVTTCFGDSTGSITIHTHGGVEPLKFNYTKINFNSSDFQTDSVFENINAGIYYVTMVDANGCGMTSGAVTIKEPSMVLLDTYEGTDITCNGLTDGSINLNAVGGAGNFEYSIDGGVTWSSDTLFTDLQAGKYTVRAKDENGCISRTSPVVTIYEPEQVEIVALETYPTSCFGNNDGMLIVSGVGGVAPYTFILNDTITQNENTFTGLESGLYWTTIIDANNCVAHSDTAEVGRPENMATKFTTSTQEGCSPLEVKFTQSVEYVFFKWIFGDGDTTEMLNPTHAYLNKTDTGIVFNAKVVARNGQCYDTATVDIMVYSQPNLSFEVDDTLLFYPDTTVLITNTNTIYNNYSWDFGDGSTNDVVSPSFHAYTGCGTYSLSVSAENDIGCVDTATKEIMITAVEPEAAFFMNKFEGCAPLKVDFTNSSSNGLRYEWWCNDKIFSTDTNPKYIYSDAGYYEVDLKVFGYCGYIDSHKEVVEAFQNPQIDFAVSQDTVALGQSLAITNYTTGAVSYIWNFGDGQYSAEEAPRFSYNSAGNFDISLKAYSANGCIDSLTIHDMVFVTDSVFIRLPNAFTPNGDAQNDLFQPVYNMVENCNIEIYNRYGRMVFKTNDFLNNYWDGTKNGKKLPMGVYVWRISGKFKTGGYFEEVGDVLLMW